jgi:hypothetical protein
VELVYEVKFKNIYRNHTCQLQKLVIYGEDGRKMAIGKVRRSTLVMYFSKRKI